MNTLADHIPVRRIALLAVILLLLGLLFPTAWRIIFAADDELSFSAGIASTNCDSASRIDNPSTGLCLTVYEVIIGNTGTTMQDHLEVSLTGMPEVERIGRGSTAIVASARAVDPPLISEQQNGDSLLITVAGLAPNRRVNIQLISRGLAAAQKYEQVDVRIDTDAVVIETNPTLTVVSRFARNLFSIFGF